MSSSSPVPRHWWGKIIGGILGLLKGGLYGVVIGVFAGHMVDRFIWGLLDRGKVRGVFIRTLFGCLGHVNKADGRVTEAEIASAEHFMKRLQLTREERQDAIRQFNAGKSMGWDLEGELGEFVRLTIGQSDMRQMFMEILLEGASTDGHISQAEQDILYRVSRALKIPTMIFVAMVGAFRATHTSSGYTGPQASAANPANAFATLGIKQSASDAEVKKAYRKLIAQYHPDRLVSKGLPDEVLEKAKHRVQEINTAYDAIKQSRGFK